MRQRGIDQRGRLFNDHNINIFIGTWDDNIPVIVSICASYDISATANLCTDFLHHNAVFIHGSSNHERDNKQIVHVEPSERHTQLVPLPCKVPCCIG